MICVCSCVEYDECLSSPCNESARCVDYVNSYLCDCINEGYTGIHCNEGKPHVMPHVTSLTSRDITHIT